MTKFIPLRRMGEPAVTAKTMHFLRSDAAAYITGQTIIADGGSTLPEPDVFLDAYQNSAKP